MTVTQCPHCKGLLELEIQTQSKIKINAIKLDGGNDASNNNADNPGVNSQS